MEFNEKFTIEDYEEQLKKDLIFDKYALDDEFVNHTETYQRWIKVYAQVFTGRKRAEQNVDKVKAQLDLEVRKDPADFGLKPDAKGKVTEAAIKAVVNGQEELKEAQADFYHMYELARYFELIMKDFEHKKELMKGTADLWIHKYYSDLSKTIEDVAETDERKREIRKGLKGGRKPKQ